jgi:hypothetical protein
MHQKPPSHKEERQRASSAVMSSRDQNGFLVCAHSNLLLPCTLCATDHASSDSGDGIIIIIFSCKVFFFPLSPRERKLKVRLVDVCNDLPQALGI